MSSFRQLLLLLFTFYILVGGNQAQAKIFQSAYLSFEIADNWNCKLEGSEWICKSSAADAAKQAIVILAAKEVGPEDSIYAYLNYLSKPKTVNTASGAPTTSKVMYTKERMIGNQKWVEGLHLGSEIPSFYTIYLATIRQSLAILVSLSVQQDMVAKFNADFAKIVRSLRITAKQELLMGSGGTNDSGAIGIPANINDSLDANLQAQGFMAKVTNLKNPLTFWIFGGILLLLGAIMYFLLRK